MLTSGSVATSQLLVSQVDPELGMFSCSQCVLYILWFLSLYIYMICTFKVYIQYSPNIFWLHHDPDLNKGVTEDEVCNRIIYSILKAILDLHVINSMLYHNYLVHTKYFSTCRTHCLIFSQSKSLNVTQLKCIFTCTQFRSNHNHKLKRLRQE